MHTKGTQRWCMNENGCLVYFNTHFEDNLGGAHHENMQIYFTRRFPFCMIFHYMTHHFVIDRYMYNFKRFVFKSFFNWFVGVLSWVVKALGERSSSFDGDMVALFSTGTFPEKRRQNKLDNYNEWNVFISTSWQDSWEVCKLALSCLAWVWNPTQL